MVRVKGGFVSRHRHKKVIKAAKGFRRTIRTQFRAANQAVMKAKRHATKHRKLKKRDYRRLWIVRVNAAVRLLGLTYSTFIAALKKKKILLDRKALADLAVNHAKDFAKLVEQVKSA